VIVLDTSVLVYATGTDHPFREPCQRLLISEAPAGRLTTTAGVIQEFVHVRQRRRSRSDAVALARDFVDLFEPLLEVPDAAVRDALDLLVEHPKLGAFDSVLAAAAIRAGCSALITTDAAFTGIRGCPVVVPDSVGIHRLVQ
jgi:predicted nucleic acid-binding protein